MPHISFECHYCPYDIPNGPGNAEAFENGDDGPEQPPELPDDELDQPVTNLSGEPEYGDHSELDQPADPQIEPSEPVDLETGTEKEQEERSSVWQRKDAEAYIRRVQTTRLDVGDTATIPTAEGPMVYTQITDEWHANATDRHRIGCFGDQYEFRLIDSDEEPSPDRQTVEVILRSDLSEVLAGGEEEAFARGKTVLEVGSGLANALEQYALDHPETTFWGVDINYSEKRPLHSEPGVHLTQGDWRTLEGVPTGGVDTIISYSGPFMWEPDEAYLDAITRVAAPNAILRFNTLEILEIDEADSEERRDNILTGLKSRGWDLVAPDYHGVAVFRKRP